MTEQDQELVEKEKEPPGKDKYRRKKKREAVSGFIDELAMFLKIPESTCKKAIAMYDEASKKEMLQWRTSFSIAGACLYSACKVEGIPRALSEFMVYYDSTGEKRFYECLKILACVINLNVRQIDPLALLKHHAKEASLSSMVTVYGYHLLERIIAQDNIQGKDPNGYIAASLYLACKMHGCKTTQEDIASTCNVNVTTMRKRLREIAKITKKR